MDVAAGGEITGQRGRPLPHLASAARILVVAIAECLVGGEPQSLHEEKGQHYRRDALRQVEMKAAKTSKPVSHRFQKGTFQFKRRNPGEDEGTVMLESAAADRRPESLYLRVAARIHWPRHVHSPPLRS